MLYYESESKAADILLRLEFVRDGLKDIMKKYGCRHKDDDLYFWVKDIHERLTDLEREFVIENPSIKEYAEEDIL